MSEEGRRTESRELHAHVLYDIAHLLESAEKSEGRIHQAIELLRQLVPYDQCALLEAGPGRAPRVVAVPDPLPDEQALLTQTLQNLLAQLVDDRARAPGLIPTVSGPHLAVPLLALDEVMGMLLVRRTEGVFDVAHLRVLSVVGAMIGAFLTMLRTRAEDAENARQLDEARRAAVSANRAKDEFVALVAHELKTPLASTLTWVHALRAKDLGEGERLRAIEAIERSVRTEAKLIDDLLALSCIASAELRLDLRAVEPMQMIKEAIEDLRPRAAERSIDLDATLDWSLERLVVDPQRLDQVVDILLANAIKITPDGGHVGVHLERAGNSARIQVIDSAPAARASERTQGAAGLELAVVKRLVELHGGTISVEGRGEQSGATFTVELPLSGPQATKIEAGKARGVLHRIRVLVVDNDRDMREALQFVLEYHGAEVTLAGSVVDALAAFEQSRPDVILSDLALPRENGFDLLRKIAFREGRYAPPAAALTAYSSCEDRERALAAGFRMLLGKPIEPDELVAAVASLAGRPIPKDLATPRAS